MRSSSCSGDRTPGAPITPIVADRVNEDGRRIDEIALNPDHFIGRTDAEICSTLVHELVHHWQKYFGTPPSRGYHNREWSAQMKTVGLQPSNTGAVGGRETSSQMTHYIIPNGIFAQAYAKLAAAGWKLNLESAHGPGKQVKKRDPSKTPFSCEFCDANIWGKPDTAMLCEACLLAWAAAQDFSDEQIAAFKQFEMKTSRGEVTVFDRTSTSRDLPAYAESGERK
jgi:hypothetical protein